MSGIVLVDKDSGISSHGVVNELRKILNIRKIGHTGSLDPMATGLMVLCVGRATKLAEDFSNKDKSYVADIVFGYETDTLDSEGKIVFQSANIPSIEEIKDALLRLMDMREQVPPNFSAIKVGGKVSYRRAVKGEDFVLPKRAISINKVEILEVEEGRVKLFLDVSKGTYIRSIARDLGRVLGSYATLTGLRRTSVGNFKLEQSHKVAELREMAHSGDFSFIQSVEELFPDAPTMELDEVSYKKYIHGTPFSCEGEGIYRVYHKGFKGLAKVENGLAKAYKYFID